MSTIFCVYAKLLTPTIEQASSFIGLIQPKQPVPEHEKAIHLETLEDYIPLPIRSSMDDQCIHSRGG